MVVANPLLPVQNIQPVLTHYVGYGNRRFHYLQSEDVSPNLGKNATRVIVIPNDPADSPYGPDGQIVARFETGQFVDTCV